MKVRVKLYARLDRYLPDGKAERNEADLDVPEGVTVADVFRRLALPPEICHLVLVNGHFVAPGARETRALRNGDHLAVWPPVAGGADVKTPSADADAPQPAGDAATDDPAAVAEAKAPAPPRSKTAVTKEMAVSHAEFFRILPKALGTGAFKKTNRGAVLEGDGKRLAISLGPERTRQIAGLKVPATDVTLAFTGYDKTEIAATLRLFERHFQKGGG